MSRLIFVPQYPTSMRYQEWWLPEFQLEFRKHFDEVLTIGTLTKDIVRGEREMFSPVDSSIRFELEQIKQYMSLPIRDSDILFLADISFPGFFTNALYHKKPKKCFAFCHATSLNRYDYFEDVRYSKFPVETAHASLFNKVFVGSKYHHIKLNWPNTVVTRVPKPPFEFFDEVKKNEKIYNFVSVSRPTKQKVDLELEEKVMRNLGAQIRRQDFTTWFEYYEFLSQCRCMIVSAAEETFGYQVMDAIMCGCIPICPNKFSYPELLPREYLYNDEKELTDFLELKILCSDKTEVPKLLCQDEVDNFYDNICSVMKGEYNAN
jgi:hypothetical protein